MAKDVVSLSPRSLAIYVRHHVHRGEKASVIAIGLERDEKAMVGGDYLRRSEQRVMRVRLRRLGFM